MWDDWECFYRLRVVEGETVGCMLPLTDDSTDDWDGDGFSNLAEYTLAQTEGLILNPCAADSDGDGLRDDLE